MDAGPPSATSSGSGGAGGGGPAPFLLKTYDMVDDSATDDIVSWSPAKNSFVVWNHLEFARILLPAYFKHNNFSSFIRQLNTYGFRKIDPERWEFANEDFVKDHKNLLKNIHRRKPIHSHSHPQVSSVDPERAAFDEEIEKLSQEKAALDAHVLASKKQLSAEKLQLEDLTQRVGFTEQRQERYQIFLEEVMQHSTFVEHFAQKLDSMDFSAYNKKRRLPEVEQSKPNAENSFVDDHSSSRPEFGNVIHQDFSNKLRLELSPAVSDVNLVSQSTQSSNEAGGSPLRKISEGDPKDSQARTSGLMLAPETLELSDTGTSYTFKVNQAFPRKVPANESPGLLFLQHSITSNEDVDGHSLNLTLASFPLQVNKTTYTASIPQINQEISKPTESRFNADDIEHDLRVTPRNTSLGNEDTTLSSLRAAPKNNQGPAAVPVRVNDLFWEQFLNERPSSTDNEEASSNYRTSPCNGREDGR